MPVLNDKNSHWYPQEKGHFKRAWKEDRGNALLGFAGILLVLGMIMIWASPPSKPDVMIDLLADGGELREIKPPPDSLLIRVSTDQLDSEGPIRIAIYDSEAVFGQQEKAIIQDALIPIDGFVGWEIKLDILPRRFAIAAYHDLDNNGELNQGLFNAPVEPYGFSNNARSVIGTPTYEQTIMERPSSPTTIEIRVY